MGPARGGSRLALWAACLLVVSACGGNGAGPDTTQAPGSDPTTTTASAPPTTLPPADTTTVPGIDPDDVSFVIGECPLVSAATADQALNLEGIEVSTLDLDEFFDEAGENLTGYSMCNLVKGVKQS